MAVVAAIATLSIVSVHNYLLFHVLVEVFSIVVACGIFMIGWNSRRIITNPYLIFIAIAYLFIGSLDLLHTVAYKGMGVFTSYDYYANQIWIATRYLESLTLLAAVYVLYRGKPINPTAVLAGYVAITAAVLASIFWLRIFPVCFVEGQGLTPFKVYSEYVISTILLLDMYMLHRFRKRFAPNVFSCLMWALGFTIASELAFTFYISNYGFSNMVGHLFKAGSFYLIYKAIIETGITEPYNLIFREMKDKERQLAHANQAKSDFLAQMSHEVRTPMHAILGMTDLTLQSDLQDAQRENLQIVRDSATHLLGIINDILDVSKMEAGKLSLEHVDFDLDEVLRSLDRVFTLEKQRSGVSLSLYRQDDAPRYLKGDPLRLRQVLINLVNNAFKFTEAGSISVTVSPADEAGTTLRFIVADTGIGIREDKLEAIFDYFTQADAAVTRKFGGTGLGLAICKVLVSLMGGDIEVKSSPGVGSTFTFTAVFSLGDPAIADLPLAVDKPVGQAAPAPAPTRPLRVLLVEDNEVNIKLATTFLQKLGHTATTARNGLEALDLLQDLTGRLDVVLMDLEMPEMDGLTATLRIREQEAREHLPRVPIIGLSAHAVADKRDACLEAGMDGYLTKPLTLAHLKDALSGLIVDVPAPDMPA